MTGRLTAKRGGTQIWTRLVRAPLGNLRSTAYAVVGP